MRSLFFMILSLLGGEPPADDSPVGTGDPLAATALAAPARGHVMIERAAPAAAPAPREPVVIASGADDRFAMPLAVTLVSALENLDRTREVRLFLLDGGMREANRRRIAAAIAGRHPRLRVEWVQPELSVLNGLPTSAWHSRATYLRLLIPGSLPAEVSRVIYLDSDLVVEADLGQLWDQEMGESPVLAVQDYWSPYVSCPEALAETYREVGLADDAAYCNGGVLVMDLRRWREEGLVERMLEYTRTHAIRFADQDGLNAVLATRWKLLDPRWNVMTGVIDAYGRFSGMEPDEMRRAQAELLRAPQILHFTGRVKPWHLGHYKGPGGDRFLHYLNASGWFGPARYAGWALYRRSRYAASRAKQALLAPRGADGRPRRASREPGAASISAVDIPSST